MLWMSFGLMKFSGSRPADSPAPAPVPSEPLYVVDGRRPADADRQPAARLVVVEHLHARDLVLDQELRGGDRAGIEIYGADLAHGAGDVARALRAVAGHDHLRQTDRLGGQGEVGDDRGVAENRDALRRRRVPDPPGPHRVAARAYAGDDVAAVVAGQRRAPCHAHLGSRDRLLGRVVHDLPADRRGGLLRAERYRAQHCQERTCHEPCSSHTRLLKLLGSETPRPIAIPGQGPRFVRLGGPQSAWIAVDARGSTPS